MNHSPLPRILPRALSGILSLGLVLLTLPLSSCGTEASQNASPTVLRISMIPDKDKTKIEAQTDKLGAYLERTTGMKVRFDAAIDYTAAVNSLLANQCDLAWLGGVTAVDAFDEGNGKTKFLATRDIDLQFKTYFIANKDLIDSGKVKKVDSLLDLAPMTKDLLLTFGSKKSTSGHIMPRHFLLQANIRPETDFKSPPAYSGNHTATLTNVAGGSSDIGALNYSTYDAAPAADRAKAPIIYTTPDYVDYAWVGHTRIGEATLDKIRAALLALDSSKPEDKEILDAWGAGKFVEAKAEQWNAIRDVVKNLPKDFIK